jgi:hypothetical protein
MIGIEVRQHAMAASFMAERHFFCGLHRAFFQAIIAAQYLLHLPE